MLKPLRERLREQIARLPLGRVAAPDHALASLILELPRKPLTIAQLPGAQFQFFHPHDEDLRAGYGMAARWETQGTQRLAELAMLARDWPALWHQHDADASGLSAFAMLGFAAAPSPEPPADASMPDALLWVPEIGLRWHAQRAALVFSAPQRTPLALAEARWLALLDVLIARLFAPPSPPALVARLHAEQPDRREWNQLVERALAHIATGDVQKVVLSRLLKVRSDRAFDLTRLLDVLARVFPSCQIINLRLKDENFVAATPERLLRLAGAHLQVDAIAGTAARAECADRDRALGENLRRCEKNQREHRVVIEAVRQALGPHCRSIQIPARPELMRLRNAQHLWSPITAEIQPGADLFDLAEQLHPTPATNGHPRLAAHRWLRAHEPFSRGWYTGAAGFIEPGTSAELWVLLRCARMRGAQAELFAGAGILEGSDPAAEWEETEAKLSAMLTALRFA